MKPGATVIISSKERFNFSEKYAGLVFPPARISAQGILMTNPGHIDPGYKGYISSTIINMGKEEFILKENDLLFTLLVIELSVLPEKDYSKRYDNQIIGDDSCRKYLPKISYDFMHITNRAKKIANKRFRLRWIVPALVSALVTTAGMVAIIIGYYASIRDDFGDKYSNLSVQITECENKMKDLESKIDQTNTYHLAQKYSESFIDLRTKLLDCEKEIARLRKQLDNIDRDKAKLAEEGN